MSIFNPNEIESLAGMLKECNTDAKKKKKNEEEEEKEDMEKDMEKEEEVLVGKVHIKRGSEQDLLLPDGEQEDAGNGQQIFNIFSIEKIIFFI